MYWMCCRKSGEEFTVQKENTQNESQTANNTRISTISSGSLSNSTKSNGNSNNRGRTTSTSSMKSIESFYSVKSLAGGDGDFYSICSADSFKST